MVNGIRSVLMVTGLAATSLGYAAELTITASFLSVLERAESYLEDQGLQVIDAAQTDRFAVLYVQREASSTTTITLYALPAQDTRVTLRVQTDSPPDPAFDDKILAVLSRVTD